MWERDSYGHHRVERLQRRSFSISPGDGLHPGKVSHPRHAFGPHWAFDEGHPVTRAPYSSASTLAGGTVAHHIADPGPGRIPARSATRSGSPAQAAWGLLRPPVPN